MRSPDDASYIEYLPSKLYRNRYLRWKDLMLQNIDAIVAGFTKEGVEATMKKYSLTQKDIALLVRLRFLTDDEITRFALQGIECGVPL